MCPLFGTRLLSSHRELPVAVHVLGLSRHKHRAVLSTVYYRPRNRTGDGHKVTSHDIHSITNECIFTIYTSTVLIHQHICFLSRFVQHTYIIRRPTALTNTHSVISSLAVVRLPEPRLARGFIAPALQVTAGQSATVFRGHVTPLQYWEDGS